MRDIEIDEIDEICKTAYKMEDVWMTVSMGIKSAHTQCTCSQVMALVAQSLSPTQ